MPSTIFVVGAGPKIGLHVALLFASKGFTSIGLASRSKANLEALASKLPQGVKVALAADTDADNMSSLEHGLEILQQNLGKPDVVVYNASSLYLPRKPLKDMSTEDFAQHFRITAIGGFLTAQWATKNLKRDGEHASTVIFTGGGLGHQPRPDCSGLAAGKAALINLTKAFQIEFPDIHFAIVTVKGAVDKGDPYYASNVLAEEYWKLYEQKKSEWQVEIVH